VTRQGEGETGRQGDAIGMLRSLSLFLLVSLSFFVLFVLQTFKVCARRANFVARTSVRSVRTKVRATWLRLCRAVFFVAQQVGPLRIGTFAEVITELALNLGPALLAAGVLVDSPSGGRKRLVAALCQNTKGSWCKSSSDSYRCTRQDWLYFPWFSAAPGPAEEAGHPLGSEIVVNLPQTASEMSIASKEAPTGARGSGPGRLSHCSRPQDLQAKAKWVRISPGWVRWAILFESTQTLIRMVA
jgi:hypothetical protein